MELKSRKELCELSGSEVRKIIEPWLVYAGTKKLHLIGQKLANI